MYNKVHRDNVHFQNAILTQQKKHQCFSFPHCKSMLNNVISLLFLPTILQIGTTVFVYLISVTN